MKTNKHFSSSFLETKDVFVKNLDTALRAAGLNRKELAEKAQLARTTLHKLEDPAQSSDPQLSTLCAIADQLEVPLAFLLLDAKALRAILWEVLDTHPAALDVLGPSDLGESSEAKVTRPARKKAEGAAVEPEDVGRAIGRTHMPGLGEPLAAALAVHLARPPAVVSSASTLARWMDEAEGGVVVLTGNGMRTEAGLPDFRSKGGFFSDPRQRVLTHEDAVEHRYPEFAAFYQDRIMANRKAKLDHERLGHYRLLAEWQKEGRIGTLLTVTTDGLHKEAGGSEPLELFGNIETVRCHRCGAAAELELFLAMPPKPCPRKGCDGPLRPAMLLRGEAPTEALEAEWERAEAAIRKARLFIVLGSSLRDPRVARFPYIARRHGLRLAIVDREPTTVLDPIAHARMVAGIGDTLQDLARLVRN